MSQLITALDVRTQREFGRIIRSLDPDKTKVKIGKELFTALGPHAVQQCHLLGLQVFLDLKFHDIPTTTANAVEVACGLGVWMTNVHGCGGPEMLAAASRASRHSNTLVTAVTVLTSERQRWNVGNLAKDAYCSGLDGVVCHTKDLSVVKNLGTVSNADHFLSVCPGIRMLSDKTHDQYAPVTPKQAIRDGADYLVMGRSITEATDPNQKIDEILKSITD